MLAFGVFNIAVAFVGPWDNWSILNIIGGPALILLAVFDR
jgi:hypothetical protein